MISIMVKGEVLFNVDPKDTSLLVGFKYNCRLHVMGSPMVGEYIDMGELYYDSRQRASRNDFREYIPIQVAEVHHRAGCDGTFLLMDDCNIQYNGYQSQCEYDALRMFFRVSEADMILGGRKMLERELGMEER